MIFVVICNLRGGGKTITEKVTKWGMAVTGTISGILLLTLFLIGFPRAGIYFGEEIAEIDLPRWLVVELLFWLVGLFILCLSVFIKKYEWAHRRFGWERWPIYWQVAVFGILSFVCATVLAVTLWVGYS